LVTLKVGAEQELLFNELASGVSGGLNQRYLPRMKAKSRLVKENGNENK
jgi:hypothetical protein